MSLNIHQLVILFLLSIRLSETFRYSMLQDINKYIFPEAKLSASSFYNTLKRLETLGLVEMIEGENGKTKSVKGTDKIRIALNLVSKYTSILGFNPELIFGEFLPIFESFIQLGHVEQVLLIDLDEFFDIGLTTLLKDHAKELFILADNESFEKYQNRTSEELFQTQVINGKIREPDRIFDVVYITDFHIKDDFYGITIKVLLQEALRVTKKDGQIIILATEELPKTDNLFLDSIAQNMKNNPFMVAINRTEFIELIKSSNKFEPSFYYSKGLLVAKIEKS